MHLLLTPQVPPSASGWGVVLALLVGACAAHSEDRQADADAGRPEAADTAPAPETVAHGGALGDPCDSNTACESGYCVTHAGAQVCTEPCIDGCPPGWACSPIATAGADAVYLCVSRTERLCRPCTTDAECGDGTCLDHGGASGRFCATPCDSETPCPAGYRCYETRGGGSCVALEGCPCLPAWYRAGLTSPCRRENDAGSCDGSRSCEGAAFGPCDAPAASPETCNGADDDCDGAADDGLAECCVCGDGACQAFCGETVAGCPYDCKICGDGVCSPSERPETCLVDCCQSHDGPRLPTVPGPDLLCGDGACMGYECGESPATCPTDCQFACGDGTCVPGESPFVCPADCKHQVCGNHLCEATDKGADECPQDCAVGCGDCFCDAERGETWFTCAIDCGHCGDGDCSPCQGLEESVVSCPEDCCQPVGEVCNGADDDCDGVADEPGAAGCTAWFADGDGDGRGVGAGLCLCSPTPPYEAKAAGDCDDSRPEVRPGAAELCNGVDDDCNGLTDEGFSGLGAPCDGGDDDLCAQGVRTCTASGAEVTCVETLHHQETCNGQDDDCDGQTDEESPDTDGDGLAGCVDDDDDGDGTPDALDCAPDIAAVHPGAGEVCNGSDDDCDGATDEPSPDTDGDGDADCLDLDDDADGAADSEDSCPSHPNPDQIDTDGDGDGDACDVDDDGDGLLDALDSCPVHADPADQDTDGDGLGDACDPDDDGDGTADGEDCAPKDTAVWPGAVEVCNGADDDCDSTIDEGSPDQDGDGVADCVDEDLDGDGSPAPTDCAPEDPAVHPGAVEACNGIDDDCDGTVDEGFVDLDGDGLALCVDADDDGDGVLAPADNCPLTSNPSQSDGDGDGIGDACDGNADGDPAPDSSDCDPQDPAVFPGAPEMCDGKDGDCDGAIDDGACEDGELCTIDVCDGQGCVHLPAAGLCFDGDACTTDDRCMDGDCAGDPASCDDGNPCTAELCNPIGGCAWVPLDGAPCDDGNACTTSACAAGQCSAAAFLKCDDGAPCTKDSCHPVWGCQHDAVALAGLPCDDGDACTTASACSAGSCAPVSTKFCPVPVGCAGAKCEDHDDVAVCVCQ